jgi:hypothetical protein
MAYCHMVISISIDLYIMLISISRIYVCHLSIRKVIPTLTSTSAEIYLSMVGAKQLVTRGLSWFRLGPYVQQWCARGTVLHCTVALAEGATSKVGEEAGPPGP